MNKKGSMELSVNSIVILVIAIVMMGLILGFVQKKFSQLDIAKNEPDPSNPTQGNPITLSKESLSIPLGGKIDLKVGVYNTDPANPLEDVKIAFECTEGTVLTATVLQQNIPKGESKIFGANVKASGAKGDYVCRICAATETAGEDGEDPVLTCIDGIEKEIFVEVR